MCVSPLPVPSSSVPTVLDRDQVPLQDGGGARLREDPEPLWGAQLERLSEGTAGWGRQRQSQAGFLGGKEAGLWVPGRTRAARAASTRVVEQGFSETVSWEGEGESGTDERKEGGRK